MASDGGSTIVFKADYFDETRDHYIMNFTVVSQSNKYYLLLIFMEQQHLVSQDLLIIKAI